MNTYSAVLWGIHLLPEHCISQITLHLLKPEKRWEKSGKRRAVTVFRAHGVTKTYSTPARTQNDLHRQKKPSKSWILEPIRRFGYAVSIRIHEYWCPDLRFFGKKCPILLKPGLLLTKPQQMAWSPHSILRTCYKLEAVKLQTPVSELYSNQNP